ncbi:hypothetical protein [Streptomyces antarcticus]|uniref:hypothetical protein n=1 Tax=Streptomyces antarcticus TaxID=2996458 RepID=UPI00226DBDEC|nr:MULTISPECIES: hypothetical protein [unclassified Streptomyces]MCY0942616.1 hypothetical protein [Streptomyces sp. H34-AA3]MCZ4081362.1 hypothetical protein [Streptomyces sp. H34-S5]
MSAPEQGGDTRWVPFVGDLVKVESTGQLGRLMGRDWGLCQVRPVEGGVEWDVEPDDLVKPTDEERVSVGVRHANALSRGEV